MLGSLELEGDPSTETAQSLRDALTRAHLQPANHEGCWVPAVFSYTLDLGRP